MKYFKKEENVCDYCNEHPCEDLLKFRESVHYVNFVADDATINALTIDITKKFTKNDKLLFQVIKLVIQNNCYKLNKLLAFLECNEDRINFKHF